MSRHFYFFWILLVLMPWNTPGRDITTERGLNLSFTGFVKNDILFDTRRNVEAVDGLYTLWPVKPHYDANGKDIHAVPSIRMFSIATRFATRISGLEAGNAKIGAYVELDFTGGDVANSVRLRHAYTCFDWPKTQLIIGRTWHPTFIEKVFPGVMALNTGVPFQVFNRSPQLRLTHHLTSNLDLMAAAVYQINYINLGPDGTCSRYQRDALLPNLHLQLQYYDTKWVLGAGFDWKAIKPRCFTEGENNRQYVTNELLSTVAALAYLKYTHGKMEIKAKSMFGQNVSESLLAGGYAVKSTDPVTGFETYTPTNHTYNFINFMYGTIWRAGFLVGFMKNLGTSDHPLSSDLFFARGPDVDVCFRISPQLTWKYKSLLASFEPEITSVSYGRIDVSDKGKVKDATFVTNFRSLLTVMYFF